MGTTGKKMSPFDFNPFYSTYGEFVLLVVLPANKNKDAF